MTALEIFISQHQFLSYALVFIGMFIEADLVFLTAAIFADQRYLNWGLLLAVTGTSVFLGDVVWYYIGKYSKESKLGLWLNRRFSRYHKWLDKNFIPRYFRIVFFTKFLYYVNRLTPFLAGWHGMETKKFFRIHLFADISWLTIMTAIGLGLSSLVSLLGPKLVLERIWIFFLVLAVIFIGGEYFLKHLFTKRIGKEN